MQGLSFSLPTVIMTHFMTTSTSPNRSFCKTFWIYILFLIFYFSAPALSSAQPGNILYLNSYHIGYKWSDEVYKGFFESIAASLDEIALHVEYLDMKRNFSEERYARLAESLSKKYEDIAIDLLVSADDASFLFLERYAATIFPGVPVFFCGTNYLETEDLKNLPNFHGITEKADIEATFSTILKLRPETKHIYIINDLTVTGQKVQAQIDRAIQLFDDRVAFTVWNDISMPDLITNVHNLSQNDVVFYTFFFKDSSGQPFEYNQSINLIYRQCPVPIFGAWDFNLDLGLTGGMLTSGYQQGKAVAGLVKEWLSKTPLEEIPRITSSPNRYMFDFKQIEKFNINPAGLPRDSIIINKPISFLHKHRQVLLLSGFFISLLLLVILFLTINIIMRKKAEKELRQSEENFRDIFYNASEGLYQATAEGQFIRMNNALAQMLKFPSPMKAIEHFTNIDNQLYTSPESRKAFLGLRNSRGWAKGEYSLYCSDGSVIDVIENAHSVTDEKGHFMYYEGSISDITEYKKTQELITQTEKIISLGGVTAGIAHEIRSPLSSIVQGVQVVQGRIYDNNPQNLQAARECNVSLESLREYMQRREIHDLLSHILEAGKRAGVIIQDMLSFSRKSIGDFSLQSLEAILDTTIAMARKDFSLKNDYNFKTIKIIKELDQEVPKVFCSASKIQQVFFNILKNGAEAMAEDGTTAPRFTLRISRHRNMARVEIEDNGPGMDQKLQMKIFDPFFTTKDREKGTGLGLSVSYFIIKENHHGDLRVVSQPGHGTTFIIELPFEQSSPEPVVKKD
jgi:PAS domain S-box-containing protein